MNDLITNTKTMTSIQTEVTTPANVLSKDEYYSGWGFVIDALKGWRKTPRAYKTYLVTDANVLTKIGKATDVTKRVNALRVGNPTIRLIAYCEQNVESTLHKEYVSKRISREWFDLSMVDIAEITSKYNFIKV